MDKIFDILQSDEFSLRHKLDIVDLIHKGLYDQALSARENLKQIRKMRIINRAHNIVTMGDFGNVWLRLQQYPKKDKVVQGHTHFHDHMSLLVKVGLRVYVEGKEPFEVWASSNPEVPTFFEVPAEHNHTFLPLEDDTVAYCVFAMRDMNGELTDDKNKSDASQYGPVVPKI